MELEDSDMLVWLVDCEESPKLANRFGIKGFPTFVLLKNGEKVAEFPGFHQKAQLLNKLMNFLA